ncbi:hypothetical protein P3T76_003766 [Phytophthora citrophthora]|uniref:DDE-1 domain-containing protein n=1 Tax=Phytophthora citrophthora TaxID=4793 RepID=A0AAD9LPS9_9STRA|nr:hypothetical protein P3T76_003766 [Phytophthora citrophthora]
MGIHIDTLGFSCIVYVPYNTSSFRHFVNRHNPVILTVKAKLAILVEAEGTARRRNVNPSQIRQWRKKLAQLEAAVRKYPRARSLNTGRERSTPALELQYRGDNAPSNSKGTVLRLIILRREAQCFVELGVPISLPASFKYTSPDASRPKAQWGDIRRAPASLRVNMDTTAECFEMTSSSTINETGARMASFHGSGLNTPFKGKPGATIEKKKHLTNYCRLVWLLSRKRLAGQKWVSAVDRKDLGTLRGFTSDAISDASFIQFALPLPHHILQRQLQSTVSASMKLHTSLISSVVRCMAGLHKPGSLFAFPGNAKSKTLKGQRRKENFPCVPDILTLIKDTRRVEMLRVSSQKPQAAKKSHLKSYKKCTQNSYNFGKQLGWQREKGLSMSPWCVKTRRSLDRCSHSSRLWCEATDTFVFRGVHGGVIENSDLACYREGYFHAVQESAWMDKKVGKVLGCHVSEEGQSVVAEVAKATVVPLPPNRTAVCQPLNVRVMGPLRLRFAAVLKVQVGGAKQKRLRAIKPPIAAWEAISTRTVLSSFEKAIPRYLEVNA